MQGSRCGDGDEIKGGERLKGSRSFHVLASKERNQSKKNKNKHPQNRLNKMREKIEEIGRGRGLKVDVWRGKGEQ